ncbi:hypothetical protein J5X84_27045 [Streptosporangiaceae bacterium NEAU-GS5]|nr:hypothetical protein [Streptosporangiaceae bacterium NEAU-GS5]
MVTPLQYGDPPHLGPFVLQARLQAAAAGLVYLALGPDGRAVSLAVLTRGAAMDAAARDRFVNAVREAEQTRSGVRAWIGRVLPGATRESLPVVAMDAGEAPWVAVPYVPGGPGAERFLDPVMVSGTLMGQRHGPDFVPYWLGDRSPALPRPAGARPQTATRRSVAVASSVLATLVLLLLLIGWLLVSRGDDDPTPSRPLPATNFVPTPPPEPASPQQPQRPASPTPSQGGTGSGSPRPESDQGVGGDI